MRERERERPVASRCVIDLVLMGMFSITFNVTMVF